MGFRAHPIQYDPILTRLPLQRPDFQARLHLQVLVGQHEFLGDAIQQYTRFLIFTKTTQAGG